MSTSSLEKLKIKKDSDGQWKVIFDDLTFTLSDFINRISEQSFHLFKSHQSELSEIEKRAMYLFVNGGDYTNYNNLLRQKGLNNLSPKALKETLVRVAAMQSGINKLPNYSNIVYRVASCEGDSSQLYNGIGDGGLSIGATTTANTFVGACRFAFVVVEHAPIVIWTTIKALNAKIQPDSIEEVTFPLGTSFKFTSIRPLDPKKIVAQIDPDADLRWVKIGSKLRPFIGLNLYYENERLPDFYFLSMPRPFRQLILPPLTFFLERSSFVFKLYAMKELKYIKQLPPEKRFQEMWMRSLDASGNYGRLPETIYLTEAEEISKSAI